MLFWVVSLILHVLQNKYINEFKSFPISSTITNVLVAWVGVNSRWGSIISISLFDWGSIRIFMGWGSNQDWRSIRADTVVYAQYIMQSQRRLMSNTRHSSL